MLGDAEPKYLNSPETALFHKGRELYGLHEARRAAQDAASVLVVEGYMDVVALAHHGVENAVATLGTAANREHSETLFRTVPNIVFCFDGDRAGRAAAARALLATLPCLADGRDAHFLFLPEGEDPDSLVRARGAEGFHALLERRVPIVDFLYEHLASDIDVGGIGGKAQLAERAKPLLATIPRGVYHRLAVRRLETLVGLPLGADVPATLPTPRRTPPREEERTGLGLTPMSRAVLLILQHPSVVAGVPPEDFEFDEAAPGADVLLRLIGYCDIEPGISTARLVERFRDTPSHALLARLATRPYWPDGRELDETTAGEEFAHCIALLRRRSDHRLVGQVAPSARTGLLAPKSL